MPTKKPEIRAVGVTSTQVAFWLGTVYVQAFLDGDLFAKEDGDDSRPVPITDEIRAAAKKMLRANASHMRTLAEPMTLASLKKRARGGARSKEAYDASMSRLRSGKTTRRDS